MPIHCKVCQSELSVLEGGRCRKCRQLVCGECVASGSSNDPDGLLCRSCVEADAKGVFESFDKQAPVQAPPAEVAPPRPEIPLWTWVVFGLMLIGMFLAIASYPAWRTGSLISRLYSTDSATVEDASKGLVAIGSTRAMDKLAALAESGSKPERVRVRAINVLGRFRHPGALRILEALQKNQELSPVLQAAIDEALFRQRRK